MYPQDFEIGSKVPQYEETLEHQDEVLRSWRSGRITPVNRIFWSLNQEMILQIAVEHSSPESRILDVGCGIGEYILYLQKKGRKCIGVDPLWDTSLLKAQKNAEIEGLSVHLCQSWGESLPLKSNSLDMVLCISTLQHVRDPVQTLCEIRRVLKNDGLILISVPQTVRKSTFKKMGIYTNHFNISIISDLLARSGFVIRDMKVCGFFPPLSREILNKMHPFVGDAAIRFCVQMLDRFVQIMPHYASSVIILAGVKK